MQTVLVGLATSPTPTLVDADNAFNRVNLYMLLDTVARRWPAGARFVFNRYRHYHRTYVRTDPGKPPIIILRKEGVAQGCVLAMLIYGISLMPLCEELAEEFPEILALWFADDEGHVGSARLNALCLAYLVRHGPKYGYYPKPEKSFHVCMEADEAVAKREFLSRGLELQFVRGHRSIPWRPCREQGIEGAICEFEGGGLVHFVAGPS